MARVPRHHLGRRRVAVALLRVRVCIALQPCRRNRERPCEQKKGDNDLHGSIVIQEEEMRRPMIAACALLLCGSALAQTGETHAPAAVDHAPAKSTSDAQALWNELLEGNRQYIAGEEHFGGFREKRAQLADHQNPVVTILACSDS